MLFFALCQMLFRFIFLASVASLITLFQVEYNRSFQVKHIYGAAIMFACYRDQRHRFHTQKFKYNRSLEIKHMYVWRCRTVHLPQRSAKSVSYTVVDHFIVKNAIFCTLSNVVLFHIFGFSGFINELIPA